MTHHKRTPTDKERAEQLTELYHQLDALITADEMQTYPFLEHLEDLITDLQNN